MGKKKLVIDAHADTLFRKTNEVFFKLITGEDMEYQITKEKLLTGGVNVQIFATYVLPGKESMALVETMRMISLALTMAKNDGFTIVKSLKDLNSIKNDNDSIGMILGIEGAVVLERNLDLLPAFHELGIRNVGLTWSRKNLFAEGVGSKIPEEKQQGLTYQGKQLVEELNNYGITIDVSHLNHKGFKDVIRLSEHPIIASHSNANSLCQNDRNLTDEELQEIATIDGVVGINFHRPFLNNNPEKASIDDVIAHMKYIADKAGVDHVGLGSDFDGIPTGPLGLEDVSKTKKLPILLEKEGFSQKDIDKIMGGNFERVFNKVWKK